MRVAFFSPLPPSPTGIADYSANVLALLAGGEHEIDVFHSQESVDRSRLPPECQVHNASLFADRHRAGPYDCVVYQMGNGLSHAFLYDHLSRTPGLLMLHDLVLHHSRAAQFLEAAEVVAWRLDPDSPAAREAAEPWLERWREELAYTYPDSAGRLFEAHLGTVGQLLPYAYPLFRIPVEASRVVAVHNGFMAEAVRAEVPGADVVRILHPAAREHVERETVIAARRRLGFAADEVVVGAFGFLTPEKRIETLARAVARVAIREPRIRLLLAGPVPEGPYLMQTLERHGVAERSVVTGRLPVDELALHIEVADIVVHLRYPTGRETSGALLRVLAQGRATVLSDLQHQVEVPAGAVLRADVADEEGEVTRAISALAADPERRKELGRRAAAFAQEEHSAERVRKSWLEALERTKSRMDPPSRDWPDHWRRP